VSEAPPTAWALPVERMPVPRLSAPRLRLERLRGWLAGMGYDTRLVLTSLDGRNGGHRGTARSLIDAAVWMGAAPWLAVRAWRERPSLVLAPSVLHGPALALIRRAGKGRALVVVDAMGLRSMEVGRTARLGPARAVYRPVWRLLERLSFGTADVVIAVNHATAELIRRRYAHPHVRTLRDAAEADVTDVEPADRNALGIPDRSVSVCFMGSVVCRRLDTLFEAWRSLAGDDGLHLVIVGDGPDLKRYRRLGAELGGVTMLGALPRQDALRAVRACDIAYTGSWSPAGFSFKLFEYLALGMPILVEAKAQMREALVDGHDALFYSTPDELAGAIRRLADDPELRGRLGAAARRTFLASHTLDTRRRQFLEVLAEAAG
jgi:glycosyltransferase involved in cell wall biosynthesis